MRLDLADQWDGVASGELTGPDGQRYRRRTTKAKRREGDQLIQAGTPLALYYWAGGQLEWFDGDEATARWQKVRRAVTSQEPRPKGDVDWTAGRWEDSDSHPIFLLTGHC